MDNDNIASKSNRREFLGTLAASAAIGMTSLASPVDVTASTGLNQDGTDLEAWFDKIKGKHKMVFDATQPHGIYPFGWPRGFLLVNEMTGTPEKDCSAVVVLRHDAIPYAFEDRIWEKYKLGEHFKVNDPATKAPAIRNPFAKPKLDEYKLPGLGTVLIGINELQASGVLFCVCAMAMTVHGSTIATTMKMDPVEISKDWTSALLPGIQVVPSGVWALGRAQERGCGYCFTG